MHIFKKKFILNLLQSKNVNLCVRKRIPTPLCENVRFTPSLYLPVFRFPPKYPWHQSKFQRGRKNRSCSRLHWLTGSYPVYTSDSVSRIKPVFVCRFVRNFHIGQHFKIIDFMFINTTKRYDIDCIPQPNKTV